MDLESVEVTLDRPVEKSEISLLTLKELHEMLIEAVMNEDYELAAKIRDEISKRSK